MHGGIIEKIAHHVHHNRQVAQGLASLVVLVIYFTALSPLVSLINI
jgi:hypothetical protein